MGIGVLVWCGVVWWDDGHRCAGVVVCGGMMGIGVLVWWCVVG